MKKYILLLQSAKGRVRWDREKDSEADSEAGSAPSAGSTTQGSMAQPQERDRSQSQESDARLTEPPGAPLGQYLCAGKLPLVAVCKVGY